MSADDPLPRPKPLRFFRRAMYAALLLDAVYGLVFAYRLGLHEPLPPIFRDPVERVLATVTAAAVIVYLAGRFQLRVEERLRAESAAAEARIRADLAALTANVEQLAVRVMESQAYIAGVVRYNGRRLEDIQAMVTEELHLLRKDAGDLAVGVGRQVAQHLEMSDRDRDLLVAAIMDEIKRVGASTPANQSSEPRKRQRRRRQRPKVAPEQTGNVIQLPVDGIDRKAIEAANNLRRRLGAEED